MVIVLKRMERRFPIKTSLSHDCGLIKTRGSAADCLFVGSEEIPCLEDQLTPKSSKANPILREEWSENARIKRRDCRVFVSLLKRCIGSMDLAEGKSIHQQIVTAGFQEERFLANLLVHMYGKGGALEDGLAVFLLMPRRNVFSWNVILGACVENGQDRKALQVFEQMQLADMKPDKVTFITTLSACAGLMDLAEGLKTQDHVVSHGLNVDVVVGTALINMYAKCGSLEDAQNMFDKMLEQDVVSWNAMIAAYEQHGQGNKAIQLFQTMLLKCMIPNVVTYTSMLCVCASLGSLGQGSHLYARLKSNSLELNDTLGNTLINMYGKCGNLEKAVQVFDSIHEPNVATWSTIIATHAQQQQGDKAFELFQQMQQEAVIPDKITFINCLSACASQPQLSKGKQIHACIVDNGLKSDVTLGTVLINMYCKCQSLNDAQYIFDTMSKRDVVTYNTRIAAYAQSGHGKLAFQLFQQMQLECIIPDEGTYASIIDSCHGEVTLKDAKSMHARVLCTGFDFDLHIGTALVSMYGKCGDLYGAWKVFDKLIERDTVAWTAMIEASVEQKQGNNVFQLFKQMQLEGSVPNEATFVSSLSACVTQAALAEGKRMHTCIVGISYESDVVVGTALVNMYGKCGCLDYAQAVFDKLPDRTRVSWNAIIAVYAQQGNAKEALQLLYKMRAKGVLADEFTFYSVLSACSHAGFVDEGWWSFVAMSQDHGIKPTTEHYTCIVDLLSRAGRLEEGENVIHSMGLQASVTSWMALLGACRMHLDTQRGERAAHYLENVCPENPAPYALLTSIFISTGRWDIAEQVRKERRQCQKNLVGICSLDFDRIVWH